MKRRIAALLVGSLCLTSACQNFLDVNNNPNAPQTVSANLYLSPMLHWVATAPQYDGRFVGRYTQQWTLPTTTTPSTWDRMGYDRTSDNGGEQWRDVYWSLGQNLSDMNQRAGAEQRWDLLGVGLTLRAWGWLVLSDLHGPIIVKEAFDQTRTTFDYDTEQYAYEEVGRLLDSAIVLLNRTDGAVDQTYMAATDKVYGGDRTKWLKFAHGLKAIMLNHYSNKATYNPAAVIAEVNASFASNADDALMPYPATDPNFQDYNFLGRTRDNVTSYRQTQFVVNLMNGTDFGGVVDPRMSRMLSPNPSGQYRGLDPNAPNPNNWAATDYPNNFFGYVGSGGLRLPGRYVFADKAKLPIMTYAELQFVKAEAAFRANDRPTALAAYRAAISAHIDFVNARNTDDGQSPTQITTAEKTAFLASTAVVPTDPNLLTMSQIMSQKYIALFGWGHNEMWLDLRRFHYTDTWAGETQQVYPGFAIPTNLDADNNGKPVYRIRPRYNSEYVWNQAGLNAIGGLALDYHTVPLWIIQP